MQKETRPRVMVYQSAGFLAIIGLSWLDEFLGLPSLILKDHPYISDFHESTLEMLLVLGVWLLVSASTRRVLEHVRRMERFMRICAWCRRVKHEGHWVRLEVFLEQGFQVPTSHDICPECLAKEKAAVKRVQSG